MHNELRNIIAYNKLLKIVNIKTPIETGKSA